MQELRIACALAEQELEGGVSPRISPLAQVRCNIIYNAAHWSLNNSTCPREGPASHSFHPAENFESLQSFEGVTQCQADHFQGRLTHLPPERAVGGCA